MSLLPEDLRPRFSKLIHEQAKGANYDRDAFLEYVGQVLSSSELPAPEKKSMLIDALGRIMPPQDSAQLSALLIILYNQARPDSIDLEVASSGWLVCPFGPHILQPSVMKKHLVMNHFEKMKGYSYENGRLIPITADSYSSQQQQQQVSPSSSSSSLSSSFSNPTSPQVTADNPFASLVSPSVSWQHGAGGDHASASSRGRGASPPQPQQLAGSTGPRSQPQSQPSSWLPSLPLPESNAEPHYLQSLPPISFTDSMDPSDLPAQTVEEICKYLPDLFTPDHFQGVSARLIDVCCSEKYSALLVQQLRQVNPESRRLFLKEILPDVMTLSQDKYGSTIIQDMIDNGNLKQRQMIFAQMEESYVLLAESPFASPVLSSLMTHLSGNDILDIAIEELKERLGKVASCPPGVALLFAVFPTLSATHSVCRARSLSFPFDGGL